MTQASIGTTAEAAIDEASRCFGRAGRRPGCPLLHRRLANELVKRSACTESRCWMARVTPLSTEAHLQTLCGDPAEAVQVTPRRFAFRYRSASHFIEVCCL